MAINTYPYIPTKQWLPNRDGYPIGFIGRQGHGLCPSQPFHSTPGPSQPLPKGADSRLQFQGTTTGFMQPAHLLRDQWLRGESQEAWASCRALRTAPLPNPISQRIWDSTGYCCLSNSRSPCVCHVSAGAQGGQRMMSDPWNWSYMQLE